MDSQPSKSHQAASVISQSTSEAGAASSAVETPPARSLQMYAEAEFLPQPRPLMIAGGWAALMTLGAAIAACWFIPYNIRIPAPAVVRPQNELKGELSPEPAQRQPESALALKAWVPNASINQVQPGQRVQVRLASCPYPDFGVLEGQIVAVSSDVVQGAATAGSLSSTREPFLPLFGSYEVHVSPQKLSLDSRSGRTCPLRAGMNGRADIWVGRETILRFLLRKARLISTL